MYTPWGQSQTVETIADGIIAVTTASHGGIFISHKRLDAMPERIRNIPPYCQPQWYEEDEDWALIPLAFPEVFSAKECFYSIKTVSGPHGRLAPLVDWTTYRLTAQGMLAEQKANTYMEAIIQERIADELSTATGCAF
jgi:hypothetical protein